LAHLFNVRPEGSAGTSALIKERAGNMTAAEEFIEFATGASPRLRRTAFLLCGNWHTAEDLA
jgi:DNA-directed RNA polymerase specialized sigma24 family protein